jgi:signal transduction protein with GAF and PtsI domain
MRPAAIGPVKCAIRSVNLEDISQRVNEALDGDENQLPAYLEKLAQRGRSV